MAFRDNLRRLRRERYISQRELAEQAGLSPVTIARLESGARQPTLKTLRALAQLFGVEPRELAKPDEVAQAGRPGGKAAAA